jgi:D-3-phosphoglycerate dehydrogenase
VKQRSSPDYTSLVGVTVHANGDEIAVTGTTIGGEGRHWLVSMLGYQIEIELAPLMAFFRYDDRPGIIGRVGNLFGAAERQHRQHGRVPHQPGRQAR